MNENMNIYHITNTDDTYGSRLKKMASLAVNLTNDDDNVFLISRNPEVNEAVNKERTIKRKGFPRFNGRGRLKKIITLIDQFVFYYKVNRLFMKDKPSVIHCHTSEQLPFLFLFSALYSSSFVYEPHELEFEKNGAGKIKKILIRFFEAKIIPRSELAIVVGEKIAEAYVEKYKISKPLVVMNLPYFVDVIKNDLFRKALNIPQKSKIYLYQGALTEGRGVKLLLELFKKFGNENKVIVFMGFGKLTDMVIQHSNLYSNIYYHPAVQPDVLLSYTASADVGVLFIEDLCLSYKYCVPNKMFEYMMANIPMISSRLLETEKIINTNNLGVVASENDIDGLLDSINKFDCLNYNELLENVKKAKKKYNWEAQEAELRIELLKIYNKHH